MAAKLPTATTSKNLKQILPSIMREIGQNHRERPDLVLAAWPELIGQKLAPMTKAISLVEGVLTVRVSNSSLLSLLAQHESPRLLKELRKKFPNVNIRTIRFCVGNTRQ